MVKRREWLNFEIEKERIELKQKLEEEIAEEKKKRMESTKVDRTEILEAKDDLTIN